MHPPGALEPHPVETRPGRPGEVENAPLGTRPPQLPDLESHGKSSARYWWVWLLVFGAIGYGCYRLYLYEGSKQAAIQAKKGAMRPHNIPVAVGKAREGDMPIYLQGLGK